MPYNILLIDDDGDDREFFQEAIALIPNNIQCTALENGISLLPDLINNRLEIPDLIFLDINVPEMDGWTCLLQLKENANYAHIPVIMYSTSNHPEEVKRSKAAGALSFFSKPYDFKELKETLKEVINHLEMGTLHLLTYHSKRFF